MPDVNSCLEMYAALVGAALPIALVFGLGNILVDTVLTAAFGGGLRFGGGRRGN